MLAAAGMTDKDIAQKLDLGRRVAARWRARFLAAGVDGQDATRAISFEIVLGERFKNRPISLSLLSSRPGREQTPTNKLTAREREHLLNVVNSDEFGSLPPSQIVPILADRG
ncbi:hypothetical protein NTG1052_80037 [Candidatus Nitrotoga sp. 1052]|nr:hypothetical protein NTG1052_80037 [Candidatus Nitrotoga sp. 1052]